MTATAEVRPKLLVEALENAVAYSAEKVPINPTIEVSVINGGLRVTGFTRFSAAIDARPLHSSEGAGGVVVDYEEAKTLAAQVKKSSGYANKGAMVSLSVSQDEMVVLQGQDVLGRLERHTEAQDFEGDDEHVGLYERLHELAAGAEPDEGVEHRGIIFLHEVFGKLNKLKCSQEDTNGTLKPLQVDSFVRVTPINHSIVELQVGTVRVLQCIVGLFDLE